MANNSTVIGVVETAGGPVVVSIASGPSGPPGRVASVNGDIGPVVVLSAADVGAPALTGDSADDIYAPGLGTGAQLIVDAGLHVPIVTTTGSIVLDMQFRRVMEFGPVVLTGNATFSVINAPDVTIVPASFLIDVNANGHAITHPAGTQWPGGGTIPPPSNFPDTFVYRIMAVSLLSVPTVLRGHAAGQNYA